MMERQPPIEQQDRRCLVCNEVHVIDPLPNLTLDEIAQLWHDLDDAPDGA